MTHHHVHAFRIDFGSISLASYSTFSNSEWWCSFTQQNKSASSPYSIGTNKEPRQKKSLNFWIIFSSTHKLGIILMTSFDYTLKNPLTNTKISFCTCFGYRRVKCCTREHGSRSSREISLLLFCNLFLDLYYRGQSVAQGDMGRGAPR